MSVKIMMSLLAALLAESFTLIYGLAAIAEMKASGTLAVQTLAFANGIIGFLFLATAFTSVITVIGVRRLVKDR